MEDEHLMEKLTSLCKTRGFIYPGSSIYGGLANSWDYGPLGAQLKRNIKDAWWKLFVTSRADMVGLDPAIIMNPKVWEASGHVNGFSDPLVECKKCHHRYRADHLLEARQAEPGYDKEKPVHIHELVCPSCGGEFTEPREFNLLFKTFIGAVEGEKNIAYLRGEVAQGMFVNFKNVVQTSRRRLPFGIAAIGKAFRNEITTGNFIFRTREFEIMELEYFVKESEWEQHFDAWLNVMKQWLASLGVDEKKLYFHDLQGNDLAHYSKKTIDIEYEYPFGRKELYGLAYRTDYDLKKHVEHSGEDMHYTDPETGEKILPHVVEPSMGFDRTFLVTLLSAYTEEEVPTAKEGETEKRIVMKFPKHLAPIQVAVLPLSKKEALAEPASALAQTLRQSFVVEYDHTQSIGKRYRRQDEIGTPYCVTFDFDSLEDQKVTIRDRDTMKQERIAIADVPSYLHEQFAQ